MFSRQRSPPYWHWPGCRGRTSLMRGRLPSLLLVPSPSPRHKSCRSTASRWSPRPWHLMCAGPQLLRRKASPVCRYRVISPFAATRATARVARRFTPIRTLPVPPMSRQAGDAALGSDSRQRGIANCSVRIPRRSSGRMRSPGQPARYSTIASRLSRSSPVITTNSVGDSR